MEISCEKIRLINSFFNVDSDHKWWKNLQKCLATERDHDVLQMLKIARVRKTVDRKGNSILHYVARTDNKNIAKYLVSLGCEINYNNHAGITPLAVAVAFDNVKVTEYLLEQGAYCKNTDFTFNFGLLHIAVLTRSLHAARVLLKAGVDVNAQDTDGLTPLQLAISFYELGEQSSSYAFVKLLVSAGADVNVRTHRYNVIPLHEACSRGYVDLIKLLLASGADVNMKDEHSYTPLYWALKSRCTESVMLLIKSGVDINSIDNIGNTCLHYAAGILNPNFTRILLENGAKTDIANKELFTPLLYAIHQCLSNNMFDMPPGLDFDDYIQEFYTRKRLNDQMKVIKLLLKYGADVNYKIATNNFLPILPPVYESFTCSHSQITEILLRYNSIFDFNDIGGQFIINLPNRSKSLHILMMYAALSNAQGKRNNMLLNFDEKLLPDDLQQDYALCKKELELMRVTCVQGTRVTYFTLLVSEDISCFTRNKKVVSVFESNNVIKKFPIYFDTLLKRFLKAKKRQALFESAMKALGKMTGYNENSYSVVFCKIISYLDKKDLQIITNI